MHRNQSFHRRQLLRVSAVLVAAAAPAVAADKSFLVANGVWGNAANWNPLGVPTVADNAFIGNSAGATNGTVSLGFDAFALNLVINDGMTLRTQLFTPTIGAHTAITGFNDPAGPDLFRSRLQIDNGNNAIDFQTNSLDVTDGANVSLSSGARMRVNGLFELDSQSTLTGSGTIDLHSNAAGPAMVVNGQITPNSGGLITIRQNGTARIDLDGTLESDQTINVTGTTGVTHSAFRIEGTGLQDAFGDRLLIGRGNFANMLLSEGWTLSQFGEIQFQHDAARTDPGQLLGSTVTVNGQITVDASADGLINAEAIVQPAADVNVGANGVLTFNQATTINGGVFDVGDNAEIGFNSPIIINGGTFNVSSTNGSVDFTGFTTYSGNPHFNGRVRQIGDATVSSASTITAQNFDMDGAGFADWTVNAPLTINALSIDTSGSGFDATMTINSPNAFSPNYVDINVQTPGGWTMHDTLNLTGPGGGVVMANVIRGSDFNLTGTMNVTGGNAASARVDVAGGTMNINAGGGFRFEGGSIANPNRLEGGRILGAGTLRALADRSLVGAGTIETAIDFEGNAELRASGGFLNIDGPLQDVGVIGTADDTGILDMGGPFNTGVAERVELLGGQLRGGLLFNDSLVTGRGLIFVDSVFNEGTISAVGGELIVNSLTNSIDLDGLGETGRLYATDGNLTIADLPADSFSGRAYVGAGRNLNMVSGWLLGSAGTLELTGAAGSPATVTSTGGNAQTMLGATVVSGPGVFDLYTGFNPSSRVFTSAAGDSLTLARGGIVAEGATFSGPGSLINASTGSLLIDADATVGMRMVNQGLLRIESDVATGIANAQRFQQTGTGTTRIKLAGVTPGAQFDRIEVTQDAAVTGAIELSTLGLYEPAYMVSHEVLRAGSVTGFFATVPNNKLADDKYLAVTYDADSVFVTAALPGDANLSGTVDIDDFAILASGFNTLGHWATGNFNGDARIDIDDFGLLASHFNVGVGGAMPAFGGAAVMSRGTAVPEPGSMMLFAPAIAGLARRRRR